MSNPARNSPPRKNPLTPSSAYIILATLNADGFAFTSLTFIVMCLVFVTSSGQVIKAEKMAAIPPDNPLINGLDCSLFNNEDNGFFKC